MIKYLIAVIISAFILTACAKKDQNQKLSLEPESISEGELETNGALLIQEQNQSKQTQENSAVLQNETEDINTSWIGDMDLFEDKSIVEGGIAYPYIAPDSENIAEGVFDSSFEKESSYISFEGAEYDYQIKRTGNRSIRFSSQNDVMFISPIPVKEGKWYIISGYMFVKSLPADVMRYYAEFLYGTKAIDIPNYPVVGVSKSNSWEEFVLPIYIKKDLNVTHIKFALRDTGEMNSSEYGSSDVWIDDLSMHEVNGSGDLFGFTKPSLKQAFNGVLVQVDELGNFSIKDENRSKPFFPIIIYPEPNTGSWGKYKNGGFNTICAIVLKKPKKP